MKKCKECGIEKDLERFRPIANYKYRANQCKECRNKKLRTGIPSSTAFKKGNIPKNGFKKGMVPHNKGKFSGNSRSTYLNTIWKDTVKKRDGNKCLKCEKTENLSCHHIKPWKKYPELRFEVSNGMTLCKVCHGKEEGHLNAENGIKTQFKKGHKLSKESIDKMKATKRKRFL